MTQYVFEHLEPLLPVDFFSFSSELPYAKGFPSSKLFKGISFLPDMSPYLGEEKFADLAVAWNEEGLIGELYVQKPFENSFFPQYTEGDSLELFIDTRDLKKAGFATRFCHHFVFLAHEVQGIQAEEVTRFRSEDAHVLCAGSQLNVQSMYGKKDYRLQFSIPSDCLHGFDPNSFQRIGFTYKVNRYKALPQHFSVSSRYFDILQHPALWASFQIKAK